MGKLLLPMNKFVLFGIYQQSMLFMPNRFLNETFYGVCVPQFKLAYILNRTIILHKHPVKLWHDVHYMWW